MKLTAALPSRKNQGPGPETDSGFFLPAGGGVGLAGADNASSGGHVREGTRQKIGAAWVELLGRYEWCWFATFTFREEVHPESADKRFRVWASQLAGSYLGKNWRRKATRWPTWVRGLEWQKRGVLHYHAVVGNLPVEFAQQSRREFWASQWLALGNTGFARVDACNGRDQVYSYLSKYVTKGGEIDVSPALRLAAVRLALN